MAYTGTPARAFLSTPLMQSQIAAGSRYVQDSAKQWFHLVTVWLLEHSEDLAFDSPLEAAFWLWWHAVEQADRTFNRAPLSFVLKHQHETMVQGQSYRLDFVVQPKDPDVEAHPLWVPIAIEVDGHTFHEKTVDQVTARNQRDRMLQQAGWRVFHFNFDEFTQDPIEAVAEPMEVANKQYVRVLDARRAEMA